MPARKLSNIPVVKFRKLLESQGLKVIKGARGRVCKNHGIVPPVFEEIFNGFKVTLYKEKITVPKDVPKDAPKDVPKDERIAYLLSLISENDRITMSELALKCKVNIKTIKRDIDFLKAGKQLQRAGGRKTGYWVIIRNS